MVLLVLRDGKPVVFQAIGEQSPGVPMRTDSVHRIASTTKIFVTTAAMRLYEQGKFKLSDPVSTYLSEFKDLKVSVADKDPSGAVVTRLEAPRRAPTVRAHCP
jgi:CubicO group peptidase (beta-lactamase class C family)